MRAVPGELHPHGRKKCNTTEPKQPGTSVTIYRDEAVIVYYAASISAGGSVLGLASADYSDIPAPGKRVRQNDYFANGCSYRKSMGTICFGDLNLVKVSWVSA